MNKQTIISQIKDGLFSLEGWDFRGQEPPDAESFVEDWLMANINEEMISDEDGSVDATDALNAYWEKEGYAIDSAYYIVDTFTM